MIYVAKNRIELHIAHEKEEPADAQLVLVFSFVREVIDALSQEGRKFEWSGVCEENWRDLEQLKYVRLWHFSSLYLRVFKSPLPRSWNILLEL